MEGEIGKAARGKDPRARKPAVDNAVIRAAARGVAMAKANPISVRPESGSVGERQLSRPRWGL
jgi:hypothetical protein